MIEDVIAKLQELRSLMAGFNVAVKTAILH